jgi:hypothetical protein
MIDLLNRDVADLSYDAILNVVVNAGIEKASQPSAVGRDASGRAFVPNGSGGYSVQTGYSIVEPAALM